MGSEAALWVFSSLGVDGSTAQAGEKAQRLEVPILNAGFENTPDRQQRCHSAPAIDCTDEALLEGIKEQDRDALAILFRRYARIVHAVARRIVRDASESEDVVQDVFLFVYRKAALFDSGKGSVRSWLIQIAYHRAIDRRRHLAAQHFYSRLDLEEEMVSAEEDRTGTILFENTLEGVLGRELLGRINDALSADQRRVIQLHFFEGYTMEEIAGILGQKVGNVRNHYYRGLEKMRNEAFSTGSAPVSAKRERAATPLGRGAKWSSAASRRPEERVCRK